jgi:hypothetical protein
MKPAWLSKVPHAWRGWIVRLGFNWHPAYRGTGGRVMHVSNDLRLVRVRLSHGWKTRNIVGSTYGGSLFSVTDGAHPMMLMAELGADHVIWDKAASIRYKRPAYTTLYAEFVLTNERVEAIRHRLSTCPQTEETFVVEIHDGKGVVYAEVERTVYICTKSHYKCKTGLKSRRTSQKS